MSERRYRSELQALGVEQKEAKHADDFFRGLGATSVDVMDVSEYEGANILHDLNQPVSTQLTDAYDCVFDGGATEHVFNFPMALKNCMEMVKVGGHLIVIAPWNNYAGQGFYQLSPELFLLGVVGRERLPDSTNARRAKRQLVCGGKPEGGRRTRRTHQP